MRIERMCAVLDDINTLPKAFFGVADDGVYSGCIHGITEDMRRDDHARTRCNGLRQQVIIHVVIGQVVVDKDRVVFAQDGCVRHHRTSVSGLYDFLSPDLHRFEESPKGTAPIGKAQGMLNTECFSKFFFKRLYGSAVGVEQSRKFFFTQVRF